MMQPDRCFFMKNGRMQKTESQAQSGVQCEKHTCFFAGSVVE